ncbi:MAG TPA: hypothetical protein VFZ84_20000 [Burkholderiales bacterium]
MRAAASLFLAALAGCASSPPPSARDLLPPSDASVAELQARRFEGVPAARMLPAALAALQDLGFQVTSSDAALGLVVARRGYQKSFEELGRDFWPVLSKAMRNVFTLRWTAPPPEAALLVGPAAINAAVVVAPQGAGSAVRIAFHRYVSRPSGEPVVLWAEELREPGPYAAFFEQISRALAASAPAP